MILSARALLAVALLLAAAGCAVERGGPVAGGAGIDCPSGTEAWVRTELFFGLSRAAGPEIGEAEFQGFVDREVMPRFPDGLTLLSAAGQWHDAEGRVLKEGAKVLVVLHPGTGDEDRRIEAIRDAYKAQFDQQAVLRADDAACVSF